MRVSGVALKAAAQLVISHMSYLALARKWRPRTFSQLVGQDHINKALIKSLEQQRLHHAYLFTGTRGVGKTSIARLMAKALNCEQGVSATPCLSCDACVAIEQGRFIDLIEVDAASKTRVEDTRDILDNVQYAPTSGRYKLYLIDEVHMLSQHSFNALLKTLEEPPAHVKFLLATTDPQKIPVTVLSRCLQFNLKHLTPDTIAAYLQQILNAEQLPFEEDALHLLAKAAQGSMRDGLSLLDQAIASSTGMLCTSDVKASLGYSQQDYALMLLQALHKLDAAQLILLSRQIASEGGHFNYVLDEILHYLHNITIRQHLPDDHTLLNINPDIDILAKQFKPEDVQLFYQIGIKSIDEIQLAPTLAIGFEMTLLRMLTFKPISSFKKPILAHEANHDNQSNALTKTPSTITKIEAAIDSHPIITNDIVASTTKDMPWETILEHIKLTGLAQNAATNAQWISKSGGHIALRVARGHQSLFTPNITQRIEQSLSTWYQETIKITLEFNDSVESTPAQQKQEIVYINQQNAEIYLQDDPVLQQIKKEFSAEFVKNSIESHSDDL